MKTKPTNDLRLSKKTISNLNAIVAGGPPVPPGNYSYVQDQTCFTCDGLTCDGNSCDRTC